MFCYTFMSDWTAAADYNWISAEWSWDGVRGRRDSRRFAFGSLEVARGVFAWRQFWEADSGSWLVRMGMARQWIKQVAGWSVSLMPGTPQLPTQTAEECPFGQCPASCSTACRGCLDLGVSFHCRVFSSLSWLLAGMSIGLCRQEVSVCVTSLRVPWRCWSCAAQRVVGADGSGLKSALPAQPQRTVRRWAKPLCWHGQRSCHASQERRLCSAGAFLASCRAHDVCFLVFCFQ